jgi:hypothetical protein
MGLGWGKEFAEKGWEIFPIEHFKTKGTLLSIKILITGCHYSPVATHVAHPYLKFCQGLIVQTAGTV